MDKVARPKVFCLDLRVSDASARIPAAGNARNPAGPFRWAMLSNRILIVYAIESDARLVAVANVAMRLQ